MKKFSDRVYNVVAKIPKGKTMTYKQVAAAAGSPNAFRAVGNIFEQELRSGDSVSSCGAV